MINDSTDGDIRHPKFRLVLVLNQQPEGVLNADEPRKFIHQSQIKSDDIKFGEPWNEHGKSYP